MPGTGGTNGTGRPPRVQLDRAGAISGTVPDKATGKPVTFACVTVNPVGGDYTFDGECEGAFTDSAGRYTLTGLGPYAWPVEFATADTGAYAWQWSGGVASRKQATPVPVTAGRTATANAALTRGTKVVGTVLDSRGLPIRAAVYAVNSDTGDVAGWAQSVRGSYSIRVLPQTIRLQYHDFRAQGPVLWFRNAADFSHATNVNVGGTTVKVDLVAP